MATRERFHGCRRPAGAARFSGDAVLFVCFALVIAATGALSPHFAWGHLPVNPAVGQSAVFLLDFLVLLAGFRFYVGRVRREERDRRRAEHNLVNSYRYIGAANRRLAMLSDFVEQVAYDGNPLAIRERIGMLLPEVAVALLHADGVLLRIVDRASGRTVTEWRYGGGGCPADRLRVRNRSVLAGLDDDAQGTLTVVDRTEGFATVAVLRAGGADIDEEALRFLRTLVRLLHLAFAYEQPLLKPDAGRQGACEPVRPR